MKNLTVYHTGTGAIHSLLTVNDDRNIAPNVPDGHAWVEGHFDSLTHKINTETGAPEQRSSSEVQSQQVNPAEQLATARRRIQALELGSVRAMRELLLGDESARQRLKGLHEQIIELEKGL